MLVEPDEKLTRSLVIALSSEFQVAWTPDPFVALRWLGEGDWYDVILCELEMPRMNGIELRAGVHAHSPELAERFAFTTASLFEPRIQEILDRVPNPALGKPLDFDALRDFIRRRMAHRARSPSVV
jgi:DNA-binding NtrC family response regulator